MEQRTQTTIRIIQLIHTGGSLRLLLVLAAACALLMATILF